MSQAAELMWSSEAEVPSSGRSLGEVGTDVRGADVAELAARLRRLELLRRRVEAEMLAVIAEVDRQRAYQDDGHGSVGGWCRSLTRWSKRDTVRRVRAAKLAADQAEVGEALFDGRVGVAQVEEMARAYANPRCGGELAGVVPFLVDHAGRMSCEEFGVVVRRWEMLADADGAHKDREATDGGRRASVSVFDGVVRVDATGGAVDGAVLQSIFERYCDAEFRTDWDACRAVHGDQAAAALMARTGSQRAFDALVQVFIDAASTPADGRAPEPVVNIVIDEASFEQAVRDAAGDRTPVGRPADPRWWRSETTTGIALTPGEVLAAAMVGHVRRVVHDSAGVVIDLGRKRRLFTGSAREAVLLLTLWCTWPGCGLAVGRCQTDHLTEWQHEGGTRSTNGGPACGRHNRRKSRGYRVIRDPDGYWHTYRPDGTEIA